MFLFDFGILICYFYFAAPQSIKGTLNVVVLVIALVAFIILLGLAVFQIFNYRLGFRRNFDDRGVAYFSYVIFQRVSQKDKKYRLLKTS